MLWNISTDPREGPGGGRSIYIPVGRIWDTSPNPEILGYIKVIEVVVLVRQSSWGGKVERMNRPGPRLG